MDSPIKLMGCGKSPVLYWYLLNGVTVALYKNNVCGNKGIEREDCFWLCAACAFKEGFTW